MWMEEGRICCQNTMAGMPVYPGEMHPPPPPVECRVLKLKGTVKQD
jgi:hypothetical protein